MLDSGWLYALLDFARYSNLESQLCYLTATSLGQATSPLWAWIFNINMGMVIVSTYPFEDYGR